MRAGARLRPALALTVLATLAACTDYRTERRPWMQTPDSLLVKPVDYGRLTSRFGWRARHPILGHRAFHRGIDWAAPHGTPVRAAAHGTVVAVKHWGGYGNYVRIDHVGPVQTVYAHLADFAPGLEEGFRISQGEVIGLVGRTGRATGPHLHFEVHVAGQAVDPLAGDLTFADASGLR